MFGLMFISTPRTLITCPTSWNSYSSKEKVHRPLDCPCFSREHVEKNQCISKHKQGVTDNDFPSVLALGFTPRFDPAKCRRLGLKVEQGFTTRNTRSPTRLLSTPLPHTNHGRLHLALRNPHLKRRLRIHHQPRGRLRRRHHKEDVGSAKCVPPKFPLPPPSPPPSLSPSHTERKKGKKKKGGAAKG